MIKKLLKKRKPADLSVLGIDVHSHLIPGIDDGAPTMDHTLGMLLKFQDLGYKRIVTTPHILQDLYPNTSKIIRDALEKVRVEIKSNGLSIELDAAAEYFFDDHLFELLEKDDVLLFGDKYLLFEFSFSTPPGMVDELIFEIQSKGYVPVLAHYERYMYYQGNIQPAENLREKGCLIQMNMNSLAGHYGPMAKKTAELLIKNKLVDLAGTDCHRIEHLKILEKNLKNKYYHKLLKLDLLNYKL